jgi:2'-5' RNA ligase
MGKASGISLWLEPQGPSRVRFQGLIDGLARDLGSPRFEPHVTLLGGVGLPEAEALERTKRLAEKLAPLEVRLTRAGVGSHYFHFLFFEVSATRELLAAHATARRAFGVDDDAFEPHLSLAYAVPEQHSPEELLQRVGRRPWGRFRADGMTVVRTDGTPDEWEVLDRLRFVG